MTTTTFGNSRYHGHDRLAPHFGDLVRNFFARLTHKQDDGANPQTGFLAGRRWCDSTERDMFDAVTRGDNFFR